MKTPIGFLAATVRDGKLVSLDLSDAPATLPAEIAPALEAYFAGDLRALDAIEVAPEGTEFQQRVWRELRRIPAGTTISYADLARRIGRPTATRAVARANATNPIALVIPCHRVIAKDGSLAGYAGGVERKRWLLEHERAVLRAPALFAS